MEPRQGPHRELDLRGAVEHLVTETPEIARVYLFGSRVHHTQSVRSYIDLLVVGDHLTPAKLSTLQATISPYLDVFVVSGSTAVSVTNMSTIASDSLDGLLTLTSAKEIWNGEWVGDEFAVQDILAGFAPGPTVAVVGADLLSVPSFDYLVVTALPEEYHAVLAAVGDTQERRTDPAVGAHATGEVEGPDGARSLIAVLLPNVGMVAAALTTFRLLEAMRVQLVLLVGIAGGIDTDHAALGDIVIPNKIFEYETAKATSDGDLRNPTISPVSAGIYQGVRAFEFDRWSASQESLDVRPAHEQAPRIHLDCTMASGQKVIADAEKASLLRDTDRKTLAVDMEAYGVAEACRAATPAADYLVIKGLTDWADAEKNDDWHPFCCAASAELAVALIAAGVI